MALKALHCQGANSGQHPFGVQPKAGLEHAVQGGLDVFAIIEGLVHDGQQWSFSTWRRWGGVGHGGSQVGVHVHEAEKRSGGGLAKAAALLAPALEQFALAGRRQAPAWAADEVGQRQQHQANGKHTKHLRSLQPRQLDLRAQLQGKAVGAGHHAPTHGADPPVGPAMPCSAAPTLSSRRRWPLLACAPGRPAGCGAQVLASGCCRLRLGSAPDKASPCRIDG